MPPEQLIETALRNLAESPGYARRSDQEQLARLVGDCIGGGTSGAFEAPTGLGKSLATLIPAIAYAAHGKRTIVATYTNVLAEQYWHHDLPFALSLFDFEELPRCSFLIGRQRYACALALGEKSPAALAAMQHEAVLGIETEFRQILKRPTREMTDLWRATVAPPVCPARQCPAYSDCWYYKARTAAETATVVITNHSVVLQDALLKAATEDELSLLGRFDTLVLDEAHDFSQAALNALEFELSPDKLHVIGGIAGRLENTLLPAASQGGEAHDWTGVSLAFRHKLDVAERKLRAMSLTWPRAGILAAEPHEVWRHPQVTPHALEDRTPAEDVSRELALEVGAYALEAEKALGRWRTAPGAQPGTIDAARDTSRNYLQYLREFGDQCGKLFESGLDLTVTYAAPDRAMVRRDTVGLSGPLKALIWSKTPTVCLSATLALDGTFDYFKRTLGATPEFEEILPSPFDYGTQAAVYLPPLGAVPDPSLARKTGGEGAYFAAIAKELTDIITTCRGRTLALFHSRREMEAVYEMMQLPPEFPILMQRASAVATVGERFKENPQASLFGVRSFWTGFDAPGDTLSCVVLVRVPFEVPVDPPQIARMAWLQNQGLNPFAAHSLPSAKMLMRQGAGRLIRRDTDRGVIALLDPRLTSKGYGEEILNNLPPEARRFRHIEDAAIAAGII